MSAIPRLKHQGGPAFLSYGFRPFFFFGACYAALAVAVWLPFFEGELSVATRLAPAEWHAHEMLFGYLSAVLAGFLLTAIPNWTGRLPLQGAPLLALIFTWAAGRFAVAWSRELTWTTAAAVDCAFLIVLVFAVAREIFSGRNWQNVKVLAPVSVLAASNIAFHIETHLTGTAAYSIRTAIAAFVALLMVIGGRIVPSFTRNWLSRENPGRLPASFSKLDVAAIGVAVIALGFWIAQPSGYLSGGILLIASLVQVGRFARWAGDRTSRERLVLVLHVAYSFIPIGFALAALNAFGGSGPSPAEHAWMVGAAGIMTLAVMTRASLGHTGRQLAAGSATQAIYLSAFISACSRITAALVPSWAFILLHVAALAWVAAFAGFAVTYFPVLFGPRVAGPPS